MLFSLKKLIYCLSYVIPKIISQANLTRNLDPPRRAPHGLIYLGFVVSETIDSHMSKGFN